MDRQTYFATLQGQDFLDALIEKINIYRKHCNETGKTARWERSYKNYYGVSNDGTKFSSMLGRAGESSQYVTAKINDYRNLIQHELILIAGQRPAGEAKAINSDPESLKQAIVGSNLVEYYLDQVGIEKKYIQTAERALCFQEGYFIPDWDATKGDPVAPNPDTGQIVNSGDLVARSFSPWNVAIDPFLMDADDGVWWIYGWRTNRYDLATKYQDQTQAILNDDGKALVDFPFSKVNRDQTDMVNIFVFVHAKTSSVPNGRYSVFVTEATLLDGDLPYAEPNIYRMAQNEQLDQGAGYTNNYDLLAVEEATDSIHSVILSNLANLGGQAIVVPKGVGIDYKTLGKGNVIFEVDPAHVDKIKVLQLLKTPTEVFNYLESLSRKKETLAGINSVVRGDPEGALRSNSGSALALVQAQSIQFNSGGQSSYYQTLSKGCTGMIKMLQRYATTERVIRITGKAKAQFLEAFKYTNKDLDKISAVVFEQVNPIEKTMGGKTAMAENLMKIEDPKQRRQYIEVMRTGNVDTYIEDDEAKKLAIISENEYLRNQKPVKIIPTENHEEHVLSHTALISTPEAKADNNLTNIVVDHIQQHLDMWQQLSAFNPSILIATGQKVLPISPPGMPPGGGPPPPGPGGPPPHMSGIQNPTAPAEVKAQEVRQPSMPTNPLTGEKAPQQNPMGNV
jgi:hypothetical protein